MASPLVDFWECYTSPVDVILYEGEQSHVNSNLLDLKSEMQPILALKEKKEDIDEGCMKILSEKFDLRKECMQKLTCNVTVEAKAFPPKQNMSLGHSEVSFNHSCLKVPVNSLSQKPSPKYERCSSAKSSVVKKTPKKKEYPLSNLYNNYKSVKSYLEFYESIPDYSELHHLSNEEFYSRLKSLKQIQKRFCGESEVLNSVSVEENYKPYNYNHSRESSKDDKNKFDVCVCCSACIPDKEYCCGYDLYEKKKVGGSNKPPPKINITSDNDNTSDLFEVKKHSGYEADQESSNLQVGEKSSGKRKNDGDEYLENCSRKSRSLPLSPGCECDSPEFCHRFSEMSFRNSGCHSRYGSGYCAFENSNKPLQKESKKIKSRPIPLTSRIPLFDKIMMEKEARRKIIHDQYSEELRSLVKPFSFTKREEEKERRRMFCSNPELTSVNPPSVRFKAKPIPKNLFSNYAYERMREEEFYRALKKRVRAEEMLKSSSLPPSMALRERMNYRSKSLDYLDYKSPKKTWHKACGYRNTCKSIRKGIELDEKNKATQKRRLKPSWVSNNKRRMNSVTDSSTEVSPYESVVEPENRHKIRPHSAFSASRNNLASVLRIETARKRMEKEMEEKLREDRLKNEAKFKERLVRMTPAWRALSFDKEEDLALRMAARKEEERIKKETHQRLMESMYGRVNSMPPLFHRQRFSKISKNKTSSTPKDLNNLCINHSGVSNGFSKDLEKDCKRSYSFQEGGNENYKSSESGNSENKSEKGKAYESDDGV